MGDVVWCEVSDGCHSQEFHGAHDFVGEDLDRAVDAFTSAAGYEYFDGTTFDVPFSAATAIDGETAVVLGDLVAGDRINVWTGACRESMPVQCDVEAVTSAR